MLEYLRDVGGGQFAAARAGGAAQLLRLVRADAVGASARRARCDRRGPPDHPADDIAACMVPGLFRRNMDEWDRLRIVYPTLASRTYGSRRPSWRSAVCRAINRFYADGFRDHADRLTPAAMIPMTTPEQRSPSSITGR